MKTTIESLSDLLPENMNGPCYILFSDGSFMMFTAKSIKTMLGKLAVTIQAIKTIGKVETNKWVCFHFDGVTDIEATQIMRQKFGV